MTTAKRPMPKSPASEPTGYVRWFGDETNGEWRARIRFAASDDDQGKAARPRPWVPLPGIPRADEERARAKARDLAIKVRTEGWTIDGKRETVRHWFRRWLDYLKESGASYVGYRSNFATWIDPALGDMAMVDVTADDLRAFVASLNRAVRDGRIRWKSATNIWGTVCSAFGKYAGPRGDLETGLVCRADDPTRDIAPPKKGAKTEKVHLYPDEFLTLVSCPEVPLRRRRAYAVAIYLYLRPAELEALDWTDFDLAHETATIQRSLDRERKHAAKAPKNGRARLPCSVEANLMPLLAVMHKEARGVGRVFGRLACSESDLAENLRADLLRAGVTRYELHHGSEKPPREWMTMHDCRTTGITWMAVRGDPPFEIVARAGHSDLEMTHHYVQKAALLKRTYKPEHVFPVLPACLLAEQPSSPSAPEGAETPVAQPAATWPNTREETAENLSQPWDLNPRPAVYETAALPLS